MMCGLGHCVRQGARVVLGAYGHVGSLLGQRRHLIRAFSIFGSSVLLTLIEVGFLCCIPIVAVFDRLKMYCFVPRSAFPRLRRGMD